MSASHLPQFGEVVKERRTRLGLTRNDIAAAGGPSHTTVAKIERGESDSRPTHATLKKLDKALAWKPGTAARALAGLPPETDESAATHTETARERARTAGVQLAAMEAANLTRIARTMSTAFNEQPQNTKQLDEVMREFNQLVSRLSGTFAAEIITEYGGPGRDPLPPDVALTLARLLDVSTRMPDHV